jgi:hypothetical protein
MPREETATAPRGGKARRFRTAARAAQTLSLGVFTDWDVDETGGDDIGFVERGGRLLSQSNAEGLPTRAGTLIVGDAPPTRGHFFSTPFAPSLSDQAASLAGSLSEPPVGAGDYRYIQSIAPLELRPGRTTDLWVAIVMGADESEFAENADGVLRDIESHRRVPIAAVERGRAVQLRQSEIRPDSRGRSSATPCKDRCVKSGAGPGPAPRKRRTTASRGRRLDFLRGFREPTT